MALKAAVMFNLNDPPITEAWLKESGFKWHQLERQPTKHWLLWLGGALKEGPSLTCYEDIGIELTAGAGRGDSEWFCWLRSDTAGRYHRFIHLRHLTTCAEVIALVEAITGQEWNVDNHRYGSAMTPERAAYIREQDRKRLDRQFLREASPYEKWAEVEKDDTRGRALPEHMEAHAKATRRVP